MAADLSSFDNDSVIVLPVFSLGQTVALYVAHNDGKALVWP